MAPSSIDTLQGQAKELIEPHGLYRNLGRNDEQRQAAYRQLFKHRLTESDTGDIRQATNKTWKVGNDRFKQRIQKQLERHVEPKARGGDRKSKDFRINRVGPH